MEDDPREVDWASKKIKDLEFLVEELTKRVEVSETRTLRLNLELRNAQERLEHMVHSQSPRWKGMITELDELKARVSSVEMGLSKYGVPFDGPHHTPQLEETIPQWGSVWSADEDFSPPIGKNSEAPDFGDDDRHMKGLHNVWRCKHRDCVFQQLKHANGPLGDISLQSATGIQAMGREQYQRGLSAGASKALENAEHRVVKTLRAIGWARNSHVMQNVVKAIRGELSD